jgi:hypothetical protein
MPESANPTAPAGEPTAALSQAAVARTARTWVLCGNALGSDAFSAEVGDDDAPAAILDDAVRRLGLSPAAARVLEVIACTAWAPGCALLGAKVALLLGRDHPLRAGVLDLALAATGLGAAVASAFTGEGGELRRTGAVVAAPDGVLRPGPAIAAFVTAGAAPSALAPFALVPPPAAALQAAWVGQRAGCVAVIERLVGSGQPLVLTGPAGSDGLALVAAAVARRDLDIQPVAIAGVFDAAKGLPTDLMPQLYAEARLRRAVFALVGLEGAAAGFADQPAGVARLVDRLAAIGMTLSPEHRPAVNEPWRAHETTSPLFC